VSQTGGMSHDLGKSLKKIRKNASIDERGIKSKKVNFSKDTKDVVSRKSNKDIDGSSSQTLQGVNQA
jgi:hypothetical protein